MKCAAVPRRLQHQFAMRAMCDHDAPTGRRVGKTENARRQLGRRNERNFGRRPHELGQHRSFSLSSALQRRSACETQKAAPPS
jgi:hypothetical protein